MKRLLLLLLAVAVIPRQMYAGSRAEPEETQSSSAESAPQLTGSADFGYRWVSTVGGDFNTYRSAVNLGAGPKLLGLDWTVRDPSKRFFDTLDLRGNSWDGDPNSTAQIDARRERTYEFLLDYRKIAYFNFLPSFANPGREQGLLLNERGFDIFRKGLDARLTLFPSHRFRPFLAYGRNSGSGKGTTVFFGGGNEFPVATRLRDHTDNYRGGLETEFSRFHVTLEQGGTTFKDDQQVLDSQPNAGNVKTPFQPFLADVQQVYGVRTDSIYSRALLTANPLSWVSVYAQFLYSRPRTSVNYFQSDRTFQLFNGERFYSLEQDFISSEARLPRSSGSFSLELRPARRIRILESWMTDRLHNTSSSVLVEQFLLPVVVTGAPVAVNDRLAWNYSQQEVSALFDLTGNLTLRGGHRYVWGDALVRAGRATSGIAFEAGESRRHIGLAGLNWHTSRQFTLNLDFEASPGDRTYFRTGLQDYQRTSLRARYQVRPSLVLSANFSLLRNRNPSPDINYDFLNRQNAISITWTPRRNLSFIGEYSRYTLRSRLMYLDPATVKPEASFYRENSHLGTSMVRVALPKQGNLQPNISFGGSFFLSSGTRPTRYLQPLARIALPFGRHVEWSGEWRWYGLSEAFYAFEGFHTHQIVTSLQLKK